MTEISSNSELVCRSTEMFCNAITLLGLTPLLSVPRVRTEFARRAFSDAGPTAYYSLPANIRLCHSVDSFKRHLKTHLL